MRQAGQWNGSNSPEKKKKRGKSLISLARGPFPRHSKEPFATRTDWASRADKIVREYRTPNTEHRTRPARLRAATDGQHPQSHTLLINSDSTACLSFASLLFAPLSAAQSKISHPRRTASMPEKKKKKSLVLNNLYPLPFLITCVAYQHAIKV